MKYKLLAILQIVQAVSSALAEQLLMNIWWKWPVWKRKRKPKLNEYFHSFFHILFKWPIQTFNIDVTKPFSATLLKSFHMRVVEKLMIPRQNCIVQTRFYSVIAVKPYFQVLLLLYIFKVYTGQKDIIINWLSFWILYD